MSRDENGPHGFIQSKALSPEININFRISTSEAYHHFADRLKQKIANISAAEAAQYFSDACVLVVAIAAKPRRFFSPE